MRLGQYIPPVPRLTSRIRKTQTGCWFWLGGTTGWSNYGCFSLNGKRVLAHRASYILFKGSIPIGKEVAHQCDNRRCVNPEHLYLASRKQNIADAVKRKRFPFGEKNHNAKLTEAAVLLARIAYRSGGNIRALARKLGVSHATLQLAVKGKNWSYL